ncbi:hypothetical protein ACLOJK_005444 [Asimina triloba]
MASLKSSQMASLVVLFAAAAVVSAQTGVPPCATKLVPCAGYLNSTSPPATCCNSIQDAVTNQLTCLCNLYNNPQLLKTFNVDPSQAFALSKNCGLKTDMSACNKAGIYAPICSPGSDGRWTPRHVRWKRGRHRSENHRLVRLRWFVILLGGVSRVEGVCDALGHNHPLLITSRFGM